MTWILDTGNSSICWIRGCWWPLLPVNYLNKCSVCSGKLLPYFRSWPIIWLMVWVEDRSICFLRLIAVARLNITANLILTIQEAASQFLILLSVHWGPKAMLHNHFATVMDKNTGLDLTGTLLSKLYLPIRSKHNHTRNPSQDGSDSRLWDV